ncbi:TonB-dependent receptor [Arenimonas caeni]|jgi:iron complex outermembrane receptor protein|uniref:TonB-dependent receptor n=1 Tax=Arenimonas caeni TaxID=2058085 RepID=UPI002A364F2B|nr:TonB-dependent receptor [Arenimonas caeni]MDY0021819.1 TonB-dependent receptor [Arenimonas caeni]
MKRNHLSLAIGLTLSLVALQAQAQEAVDGQEGEGQATATTLDTVEVTTARRRAESIDEVPVAVSAFGESALRDLQATNIDGLQGAVPNMNIVQGRGSSNSVNVFIRGIGQPDALQTFDPGVGMYVDDVYYSRINGALFSLFDVNRVEVLRGPQGTLYGKNSTGGAVKISTRDPFEDQGGAVELTVGDYGRLEGRAYVSGQFGDSVAMSLAAAKISRDGYVTDPSTGKDYNDEDTAAARFKLGFRAGDDFTGTFSLDYTRQDNALTLGRPVAPLYSVNLAGGIVLLSLPETGEYDFRTRTSFAPDQGQDMTHKGAALNLQWQLSDAWTAKSITAWRKLDTASFIDIDASEFELGDVFVGVDQRQLSQELQLQYDNGDNLRAIFGLYYMDEQVPSHQEAYADDFLVWGATPISFLRTIDDDLSNKSVAGFVHVDWDFAPTWTLAAGLRYTKDSKDYYRTTSTFSDVLGNADPALAFSISDSWTALTPSLSLQKAFSDNMMGYVSANRGYKAGGFNGRANAATEISAFEPEYVWTYEAGLKMRSGDGRLSGRIAAFHSQYKDFQARVSEVINPNDPIPNFAFPVLNAAELAIDGIEFEGVARLGEGTLLSAQLGWMNARYEEFIDPRVAVNPALANLHDNVPFSPDFTARIALQHGFELANGSLLTIGGDVSYRDETWLSVDNAPGLRQGAYTVAGLFGGWDSADGRWQGRLGVRNLTDEVYKTDGQEFSSIGGIQTVYYGAPRNYYASIRYNF